MNGAERGSTDGHERKGRRHMTGTDRGQRARRERSRRTRSAPRAWWALAAAVCGVCAATALPAASAAESARGPATAPPRAAASAASADDGGTARAYDVTRYDVRVDYAPETGRLEGDTKITARATADLARFGLDLALTVRAVEVDGVRAEVETDADGVVTVVPGKAVARGDDFTVRVRYGGEPGRDNPSWAKGVDGGVVTVLAPVGTWFPGDDDPGDPADFALTATVPKGWTAVSGGREGPVRHEGDRATYRWDSTEPLTADRVILGMGKWDVERGRLSDGTPLTTVYGAGRKGDFARYAARQRETMDFLTARYGPYPYATLVSFFLDSESEDVPNLASQGAVIFPNAGSDLFDSSVVAHELTHQWYGMRVRQGDRADLCLSECFASYAQWMWVEHADHADLDAKYRAEVARRAEDGEFWRQRLSEGAGAYDKGPLAVHALRRGIGEAAFAELLKAWPAEFGGRAPKWSAMEQLAERVSGRALRGFFDAWVRGDRVPDDTHLWPGPLDPGARR